LARNYSQKIDVKAVLNRLTQNATTLKDCFYLMETIIRIWSENNNPHMGSPAPVFDLNPTNLYWLQNSSEIARHV
jgi:hypothetical protein